MKVPSLTTLLLLAQSCFGQIKDYSGYQVHRVTLNPANENAVSKMISDLALDAWVHPSDGQGYADVQVPPALVTAFKLATAKMATSVMHSDLGESIRQESQFDAQAAGQANDGWFSDYHSYAQHLQFLKDLQARFPRKVQTVYSGTSIEKRRITGIKISAPGSVPNKKPAIVWHGTVHAREWIGTMVVEYLAFRLLRDSLNDASVRGLLNKYDFYVFPVVNPDGFVYTQTVDRLARKNRRPSPTVCVPVGAIAGSGVDINRNWAFEWAAPNGSSTDPCTQDYRGASPASEPETQGLQAFLNGRRNAPGGLKQYIDFHSYSQLFMWPYGYTCNRTVANNPAHAALANTFTQALRAVHGTEYGSGPICPTLYAVSGGSVDYAYNVSKSEYVFTAELRDKGNSGFLLPKEQIRPSGEETWAGIKAVLLQMK